MAANSPSLVLCFSFAALFTGASCLCTWPTALQGTWSTSESKTWVIDSNNITFDFGTYGASSFECYATDGYRYLARIPNVLVFPNIPGYLFDIFLCLEFQQLSANSFLYWRANNEHNSLNKERAWMRGIDSTTTTSQACEITKPYTTGTHDMMLKSGQESTAIVTCPSPFNANAYYYYDYDQNRECGPSNSSFVGCTNTNIFTFDYTACSDNTIKILYSTGGNLNCLYYTTDNSRTYLNLYNQDASPDGSTTYRFSCMVYSQVGTTIFATQHPQHCHSTQTHTYVPFPDGNDLYFGVQSTCGIQEPYYVQPRSTVDDRSKCIPPHLELGISSMGYPGSGRAILPLIK